MQVVAYYRVSTDKQGRSGLGLEAQKRAIQAILGPSDQLAAEYTEIESGRRNDRPQLAKALHHAKINRAALIVAKVDRLARNVHFLETILNGGVEVRFADLPQLNGPTGRFILQQMAAVAQLETGLISERTKAALAAAKARGKKLGGYRGHSVDPKMGTIARQQKAADRASDLAPIIFEIRAAGATTLTAVADALNKRCIPAARSGKWSPTKVMRLLRRLGRHE